MAVGIAMTNENLLPRLRKFIFFDPKTTCWLWQGDITSKGYAQFRVAGKSRCAHRVAYEIFRGLIPDGLQLDHLCRVRHCVNPDHLQPVTHAENLLRGKRAQTHCTHGHEWTKDNTRLTFTRSVFTGEPRRKCRECVRFYGRLARQRKFDVNASGF